MESFNRGEHVIAAFLDVEKAFDSVWHNGLRYKICQLDLPTKLCRWLSDFLVGRVIQVKIESFLSPKVYPKAGVPQGSNLSPILFLSMSMTCQIIVTTRLTSRNLHYDASQCAVSKNIDLAAEYLQKDNKSHKFLHVPNCNKGRTCFIFIRRRSFVLSSHKILRVSLLTTG